MSCTLLTKPPKRSTMSVSNRKGRRSTMKKLTALLLCSVLCAGMLAACAPAPNTPAETTAVPIGTTAAPTDTAADTAAADETTAPEETTDAADIEYDPELFVVIKTAEDLMAFNKAVNEEGVYFDDMTVTFLADIDMEGHEWIPLDGSFLMDVTFEGNGHTIRNLQFAEYAPEAGTDPSQMGSGFVGVANLDMTFQNLTIDTARVTAYERAVGCFVGVQTNGFISFENCAVKNFTADGWMDYGNQDRANGGHPISFRLAGFVGHNLAGQLYFNSCHVENVKLSGFHNLAAFVGYGSATLDAYAFEDCTVKNLECYFSYCMSNAYTIDQPKKYVSVFFNAADWVDNVELCVEMGNTFEGVSYYDWSDDNAEYTPADFRSRNGEG